MLNELGADYEVVNVLDEQYNPTLREVIKQYSEWPTIPQVQYYAASESWFLQQIALNNQDFSICIS